MPNQNIFNLGLVVIALAGLTAIFYPMRQQAVYFNECVEGGRAEVFAVQKDQWLWYGRSVSVCNGE